MRLRPTLLGLALVLIAPEVAAQERREVSTFIGGKWQTDAIFGGATLAAVGVATFALKPSLNAIAPLDGLGHRPLNRTFNTISNVVEVTGLLGIGAMGFVTEYREDRRGADLWRSTIVMAESAAVAMTLVQLIKNVGVCRPRSWNDTTRTCDPEQGELMATAEGRLNEAHRSFPSGHTAPLAALAGASAGLWLFPTGRNSAFLPVTIVSGATALSMVALRPLAGAHSWVDTSTGFLIGSASGLLVAYLHTRTVPNTPTINVSTSPVQVSLGGSF